MKTLGLLFSTYFSFALDGSNPTTTVRILTIISIIKLNNKYFQNYKMYKISRDVRVKKAKTKERRWLKVLKTQAKEFCLVTGLHGYKYIAQSERSKVERIIWGIMVLTSLGCAAALMRIAWEYNSARPTLTVIESTHHGIWNYPFPAVTVCNLNRVSLRGAKSFISKLKYPGQFTEEYMVSQMGLLNELLIPGLYEEKIEKNLTQLQDIFDANGYSISDVIKEVSQNCSDLILACKWKGSWINCSDIFKQSLSRDGICCSFNYIDSTDPRIPPKERPKRVTACGYQTGLTIFVNPDPDDYLAALLGSYGVKIMLHYPFDFPDYNAENKLVGMGYQVFLSISPEETYSTGEVRELPVATRDCVFSDERKLSPDADLNKYNFTYAEYTYKNCMTECRATTIRKMCQCVPYYMQQTGSPVCDLRHVACLRLHNKWWETSWPGSHTDPKILSSGKMKHVEEPRPCECLPDCRLYRYPVEGSLGMIDGSIPYADLTFLLNKTLKNESVVHIFFSDLVSIQYRRNAYYNWRNLFASFGGLLGLFAGFSLMSVYELIYFFVIRVINDACMKKKSDSAVEASGSDRMDGIVVKRCGF